VDLLGEGLNLGMWKLMAAAVLSFAGMPTLLGYLVQAAR
jgi:hypothetical protein